MRHTNIPSAICMANEGVEELSAGPQPGRLLRGPGGSVVWRLQLCEALVVPHEWSPRTRGGVLGEIRQPERRVKGLSVRTRLLGERGNYDRRRSNEGKRVSETRGKAESPGAYGVRGGGDRDRRPVDGEHDAMTSSVTGVVDARNPGRIGRDWRARRQTTETMRSARKKNTRRC